MKTPEQIQKMRDSVAAIYASLPDYSVCGSVDNRSREKYLLEALDKMLTMQQNEVEQLLEELEIQRQNDDDAYEAVEMVEWVLGQQDELFEEDWGYEE